MNGLLFCWRLSRAVVRRLRIYGVRAMKLYGSQEEGVDVNLSVGALLESDDPKDKIITSLVGSLSSHPAFKGMTSNLILALHGPHGDVFAKYMKNSGIRLPRPK